MNHFTTDRLTIRKISIDDAEFIRKLVNSPGWLKYIGDRNVKTKEQSISYTQSYIDAHQENGFGFMMMVENATQKNIGLLGLIKREELPQIDLGFAIMPQFFGKGYTFEGAQSIMQYAFTDMKLNELLAITTTDNIASQSLLKKLGFHAAGSVMFKGEELVKYVCRNW